MIGTSVMNELSRTVSLFHHHEIKESKLKKKLKSMTRPNKLTVWQKNM